MGVVVVEVFEMEMVVEVIVVGERTVLLELMVAVEEVLVVMTMIVMAWYCKTKLWSYYVVLWKGEPCFSILP